MARATVADVERWSPGWHRRLWQLVAGLADKPPEVAAETRRQLGRDPVAFAVLYLRKHLTSPETGGVSFSEVHYEWARRALTWAEPVSGPMQDRHADIAPRDTGKSTWWYLLIPLWAAANGHVRFVAAFADSAGQAEGHLSTFKLELDNNPLLRHDYPDLCTPARRQSGGTVADRQSMLHTASGFTFAARGIDSAMLGLKVEERRPDVLILDDVEPDEASYSPYLAEKRLGTVIDAVFPLNVRARVQMVGTVTMPGSITHQLVKAAQGVEVAEWIADERIQAHHHRAIVVDDDGTERSVWPEKWPLAWLQSRRHTREFAKNYDNDPLARAGVYWVREDFRYGPLQGVTRTLLAIDPILTEKKSSDWAGLAVVGWRPPRRLSPQELAALSPIERKQAKEDTGECVVRYAKGVQLTGGRLRDEVVRILNLYPEIRAVLVETNAGGELWKKDILVGLPGVKVLTHWSGESKEVRFAGALGHYQRRRVRHERRLDILEEQAVAFPRGAHDDVVDAAAAGIAYFLEPERRVQSRIEVQTWT
jgi:hypothetical protein